MVCRTTSIRRRATGFTLLELLIASSIAGLVFVAAAQMLMLTGRSSAALYSYVDLDAQSSQALAQIGSDIRQVLSVTNATSTSITFLDYDGQALSYSYNAAARALLRTKAGAVTMLLTNCDSITFSPYQRNPIGGTYDNYPAASDVTTAKLIQVTWLCSCRISTLRPTDSMVSAKFVIRHK